MALTANYILKATDGDSAEDSVVHDASGIITVDGTSTQSAEVRLAEDTDNGTNYLGVKPPAAVTASKTFVLPDGDGTANQVLETDGSLTLSWATKLENLVEDTTPQLGGNLDLNSNVITGLEIGTDVLAQQTIGIADDNLLEVDDADAADNDYAKFTANGLEGREYSEVRTDLGLVIGTDVLAEQTIGIADDNLVEMDDADAADDDYAKFTANGLEGRSYAEVKTDLSLENVDNTSDATKNAASVSLTNKTIAAESNTITPYTEVLSASHTLSAAECYGGVYYVDGAATLTLPAIAAGMQITVYTVGAVAISIDPNASDLIVLDGTAGGDGKKITNTSTAGDVAVLTYYGATGWYASTNTWTMEA